MNNSNGFGNSSQGTGYPNMDSIFNPGVGNQNSQRRIDTNYTYVTSLQEAMQKYAPFNSKGLYIHQDGEYEFEIFTDYEGKKSYKIFKRIECTKENDVMAISKQDIDEIKDKLKKLEDTVYGKSANDTSNGTSAL